MNCSEYLKEILTDRFGTFRKLKLLQKENKLKRIHIFTPENSEDKYLIELYRFYVQYYRFERLFSEIILIWQPPNKKNKFCFVDSYYLADTLHPDYFHFWIASLVTFYRQQRNWDYNHEKLRIQFNNKVKNQIVEDIINSKNLNENHKLQLLKAGYKLLNNTEEFLTKLDQSINQVESYFSLQDKKS